MRSGIAAFALTLLAAPALLALGGCDDPFGSDPAVYRDTVTLAAPTVDMDSLPSALDLTDGVPNTPRWPDRIADANAYDLALRLEGGRLVMRPFAATEFRRGAGIRVPDEQNFERLDRARTSRTEYGDSAVTLVVGRVYMAHSREYATAVTLCQRYSKFTPLALDPAKGTARILIQTNALCDDPRLND